MSDTDKPKTFRSSVLAFLVALTALAGVLVGFGAIVATGVRSWDDRGVRIESNKEALDRNEKEIGRLADVVGNISAVDIIKVIDRVVVHTPGTSFSSWDQTGLRQLEAPIEPATETYQLDEIIDCRDGYVPVVAWHEISASYPSSDVLYTVNPRVSDAGGVEIAVRTRRSWEGKIGYAYIDLFVVCKQG